ncbi:hypothetical protein ABT373_14755 [Streptomyces sp. NPDC000070]|uniref:hypothetical protein n=1 Tax=Streptomyces sp. NPDC000070 TaxID=3154240 RepID=UPI003326CD97
MQEVVNDEGGAPAGLRLVDDTCVERRVVAVAAQTQARTEGLDELKLPMEGLPGNRRGQVRPIVSWRSRPGPKGRAQMGNLNAQWPSSALSHDNEPERGSCRRRAG